MNVVMKEGVIRVVILDISGIYTQIHNEGYFDETMIDEIRCQYSDTQHWRVVVLDRE